MPSDDLETRFIGAVTDGRLVEPGQLVIVAVSGGPDSVALLHLFLALNRHEPGAVQLHVAHLDHQLRGDEARQDAEFVRQLSRDLGLPCTVESADVTRRAETDTVSIEQAGRRCRFEFYERLCLKLGGRAVALGHHADDNAETILHRIVRGTGLRGLAGIRASRPIRRGSDIRLIRPLLGFRRAEIERYLADRGVACRQDPTNASDAYTRNRIRHEVLPLLRDRFNPQVTEALLRLGEQARGLDAYLTETAQRMLESIVVEHDDRQLVLHSPSLARRPPVIRMELLRQAILRMGVGERELTFAHLHAVSDLAAGREGSKAIDLPAGLRVTRRYARLVFERRGGGAAPPTAEVRVCLEGTTEVPGFGLELHAELRPAAPATIAAHIHRHAGGGGAGVAEEWLDADRVHPPLVARSRRPGDRFFPLGMRGMKKLSDFFIDEKIDARARERALVLCDQLGPIWIVPWRIDDRVRLTRATRRILRLEARPMPGRT